MVADAEEARLPSWYVRPTTRVRRAGGASSMRWMGMGPQTPPTKNCRKKTGAMSIMFLGRIYAGTKAPPVIQAIHIVKRRPPMELIYPIVVPPSTAPIWPITVMMVVFVADSPT